ncbi:hypothetical protein EL17_15665 [Anditalea andensis]|uniref:Haem-binding uptake Tiki superfamily ChaN domain-containing protein n=2 Tax=Anditalea andensis TaxID=1048983 RepID=A0A074LGZ1_9BACT|nr:hypothetical protein EL17_15665 [Anditalea andensis]
MVVKHKGRNTVRLVRMKSTITIGLIIMFFSCVNKKENETLVKSIKSHSLSPEQYIVEKFRTHQVIFIGENHFIKEQVELIKDLIPVLYENGVYNLGTEFIRYSDTGMINELISGSTYSEELARQITFNSVWHWGYQEYLDIYKAAWELNSKLAVDAPRFRIFGIEDDMDFSFVQSEEDYSNPDIMKKVFKSKGDFEENEGYSAYAVDKEVIEKSQKALIHCGIHHAFTGYLQPIIKDKTLIGYEKERMGNLVKNKLGDRTMTVFIHGPWYDRNGYDNQVLPLDGVLDSLFSIRENRHVYPFGIDTKGTLLGELKGINAVYQYGYTDFSLRDFCDGYIFLKPINEYRTVTPIDGFVKPENVEYIKQQELDFRHVDVTANDLNDTIKIWLDDFQLKMQTMKISIR